MSTMTVKAPAITADYVNSMTALIDELNVLELSGDIVISADEVRSRMSDVLIACQSRACDLPPAFNRLWQHTAALKKASTGQHPAQMNLKGVMRSLSEALW